MILNAKNKKKIAIDRIIAEGEILHIDVKLKGKDEEEKYTLIATTKPTMTIENNKTLGDGTTKTIKINYPNIENVKNYYTLDGGESWEEYTESINLNLTNKANFLAKIEYIDKESSTGDITENTTTNKRRTINKPISYLETLGITFSSITWQNGKASIEILANNKENIEYQINDNTIEANWQKGYNVNNLNYNDIVYARLKEENELIDEASIKIEDIIPPTVEIEVTKINAKNITVDITKSQDNQTGIRDYTYIVEKEGEIINVGNITKEQNYNKEGKGYNIDNVSYNNSVTTNLSRSSS